MRMLFHNSVCEYVKMILRDVVEIVSTTFRSFRIAIVSIVSKFCDTELN
jgi:hypothetical protein